MRVRDVLTEAEFRDIAVYAVEVSHFLASLNYHPDPPRPSPIPPEARSPSRRRHRVHRLQTHKEWSVVLLPWETGPRSSRKSSPLSRRSSSRIHKRSIPSSQAETDTLTRRKKGWRRPSPILANEIHSQYLLTYLPNNPEDSGYHEIEVKILKPGLKVSTRPGYWSACTASIDPHTIQSA